MKKLVGIILAIVIVILLGTSSLTGYAQESKKKEVQEYNSYAEMKDYFDNKYKNVDYEVVDYTFKDCVMDSDIIEAETYVNGEKETFLIEKCYEKDGSIKFYDNYFGLTMRNKFEAMLNKKATKYFEDCKNYAFLSGNNDLLYPKDFNKYSDLKKRNDEINDIVFYTFVNIDKVENEADIDEIAKDFVKDVEKAGISVSPRIIYLNEDDYTKITRTSGDKFAGKSVAEKSDFK